jgi:hypothetical protein
VEYRANFKYQLDNNLVFTGQQYVYQGLSNVKGSILYGKKKT